PQPPWRRQQRRDLLPFRGPRIACVAQLLAPILNAGGFSPHVVSPGLSDNNTESQLAEITQFISSQALRMTIFFNAIKKVRHPEERPEGASRRTHLATAAPISYVAPSPIP